MSLDGHSTLSSNLHAIDAFALVVAQAADTARQQARVVASAAGVEWAGPASRRFRTALDDRAHHVSACAGALDDLAAALRRHAAAARAAARS